jgi:hypothetical protein
VGWGDGTTSWIPLKDKKNSNPIEAAEYAVAQQLAGFPAFAWWVRTALRARDRFIKKVKTRYCKRTHKNGIAMPKSVSEALAFDKRSGTDFSRKSIKKERLNVMPAFEFRDIEYFNVVFDVLVGTYQISTNVSLGSLDF